MPFFWSTPVMILTVGGRFLQHSASPKPFSFPPQLCKDPKRICSVLESCYRDWDHLTIVTDWDHRTIVRDWDHLTIVRETGITQALLQRLGSSNYRYTYRDWDHLTTVTDSGITWALLQRPGSHDHCHRDHQPTLHSMSSHKHLSTFLCFHPSSCCQIQIMYVRYRREKTIYVYLTSDPVKRQLGFWEMQQQSFNDSKHEREAWISETMNTSAVPEDVEDTSWQTMRQTDK